MKFKFFGTEIKVSFMFFAIITLVLLTDKSGFALPAIFAVFVHECGHLTAMHAVGDSPRQICLIPASVKIVRSFKKSGYDMFIAISGPLANLLIFTVLLINYKAFGNEKSLEYAVLNLVTAIFNLIPVKGLDGGIILYCALNKYYDEDVCEKTVKIFTLSFAVIFLALGTFAALQNEPNISIFIIAAYLIISALIKL